MLLLAGLLLLLLRAAASSEQFDYCIIGAGPGGLQVGHLMLQNGWNYITLERNENAGSFFERSVMLC